MFLSSLFCQYSGDIFSVLCDEVRYILENQIKCVCIVTFSLNIPGIYFQSFAMKSDTFLKICLEKYKLDLHVKVNGNYYCSVVFIGLMYTT